MGAALAGSASVASAVSAALTTGIKLAASPSAASSATAALTTSGSSTPTPTGFSGSLTGGSSFTVTGSNFGSQGPTILLFEDFESDTPGSKISLTGPPIGEWTSFNSSNGFTASNVAHTGSVSFNVNDVTQITNGTNTQQAPNILNLSLGGSQTELFYSLWTYTPNQQFCGVASSGTAAPSPGNFPVNSCWKMTWVIDSTNTISGPFNLCIPTFIGSGFSVQGESQTLYETMGEGWWSFSTWNRISTWLRGAPSATGSQSTGFIQTLNSQVGMNTFQYGTASENPLFTETGANMAHINIPGFTDVINQSQLPLLDDIYVAVGAGSVACVEIGDASTYAACQHMTRLLATSWADGSVTSTVPRAGLDFSGQAYAYVWNAEGVVNSSGLAV